MTETCKQCRKWLKYPQANDANVGICIDIMNGHRGNYFGGLKKIQTECPNYGPMTFSYISCEYFEKIISGEVT